jgi:hypothetical protein
MVFRFAFGLGWLAFALTVSAAPLDALLTATPEQIAQRGYVELGTDHMNQRLDFLNIRESDPLTAGTKAGDYLGGHVSAAVRAADGVWLSGSLWKRTISNATDTFDYTSWQVAGLYRFIEANGRKPALALRLSAWGTRSAATESTAPVVVPGAILNTVKITEPADRQLQADLIGTWKLTPATDVSALLSAGSSKLSYGALSATTTRNLCNYQLTFNGNDIFGTLAEPCSATGGVIQQFYDSSGDYGVDVASEIAWHGYFIQAGVNSAWRNGPWTLQGGYLFHVVRRSLVDDILAARSKPVFTQNHGVTLQADYRFNPHLSAFARGQYSSNLFFSEIPVTYNSSTSDRFSSRYTLFTLGLRADF